MLGGTGDDQLDGRGGRDYLSGWIGDDTLLGGDGNDTLLGGAGADSMDGGMGIDVAVYDDQVLQVLLDLQDNAANAGAALGDMLAGIENIRGSDLADTIAGDAADNRLMGLAGNDSLSGREGDDTLVGSFGNDTLTGGGGADLIRGGVGRDVASYLGASSGVTVDLADAGNNSGDAAGDILLSIEALRGTIHDDVLAGNGYRNALHGYAGDDALYGRGGDDWMDGWIGDDLLAGGTGDDTLTGGDGVDVFLFETAGGDDTITDFDVATDVLSFLDVAVDDVVQLAGDTVVSYGDGATVTLSGVLTTQADLNVVFAVSDPLV